MRLRKPFEHERIVPHAIPEGIGEAGAHDLLIALEAMAGVAARGLMDTHSGVRSWVASRHYSPEFVGEITLPDQVGT